MLLHFLSTREIPVIIEKMKLGTVRGGVHAITVLTKRNKNTRRQHLFAAGELAEQYKDWNILSYDEDWGQPFFSRTNGRIIRQHRAVLIARHI